MTFAEIASTSILTRSKLPDIDFVINPYVGCQFGCSYCFATFMCRMVDKTKDEWGSFVFAKKYSEDKLLRQLSRLPSSKSILMSSVTDPYGFIENELGKTRTVLEIIKKSKFSGRVNLLTKSPSVIRDLDLLKSIAGMEVGLTIPIIGDPLVKIIENKAPVGEARLAMLERLRAECSTVFAFFGPMLPHQVSQLNQLNTTIDRLIKLKLDYVFAEMLDPRPDIWHRMSTQAKISSIDIGSLTDAKANLVILQNIVKRAIVGLQGSKLVSHKD